METKTTDFKYILDIKNQIKNLNLESYIDRCVHDDNCNEQYVLINLNSGNYGVCFETCLFIDLDYCFGDIDTPPSSNIKIEDYEINYTTWYRSDVEVKPFILDNELNELLPN